MMFDLLRNYIQKFTTMPDEDWQLLLPHLVTKDLTKGDRFCKEGKVCKEIGFVVSGNMRHYYTKDGEERTTYFYFENSMATDYISCISGNPGSLTIEAMTDATL